MHTEQDALSRRNIGEHVLTCERSGVLHLVVKGTINAQEAEALQTAMYAYAEQHPDYEFIAVVSAMTGIDTGGRHQFVRPAQPYPFRRCYLVGASFAIQTVVQGVYRAGRALRPQSFAWLMFTVATEEEARRIIAANRRVSVKR